MGWVFFRRVEDTYGKSICSFIWIKQSWKNGTEKGKRYGSSDTTKLNELTDLHYKMGNKMIVKLRDIFLDYVAYSKEGYLMNIVTDSLLGR